ncbi:MAG: methionyl-tRNA formyltransferase [Propionibacteriaceae bacterium]|nr:methionyl-tRNA formyltransferase [Propionibacteriaceae bacterium]
MRVLFAGTPATALPVLESVARDHDLVAVLTRPPAAQGRKAVLVASPVEQWARDAGVEVLAPASTKEPGLAAQLRELEVDACPVVAYGGLLTQELLDIPRLGWLNLHYSLLPAYRGAAPVQQALLDGCVVTGITVFRIVKALDAGPIYVQHRVDIGKEETAGELLERLSLLGVDAMAEALDKANRGVQGVEQLCQGVSLAPKIEVEDARLDLSLSAERVILRVRAMSPDPGAWVMMGDQRIKVLRARMVSDEDQQARSVLTSSESQPGSLVPAKKALYCRTRDRWIELVQVHPQGKKPMAGADWGRGLGVGARLG